MLLEVRARRGRGGPRGWRAGPGRGRARAGDPPRRCWRRCTARAAPRAPPATATSASTVLLPVPGGPWTRKKSSAPSARSHGVALLGVERAGGLERRGLFEAGRLVAEQHLAACARSAPLSMALTRGERGAGALVGDVVGDEIQAEPALVDPRRRGAIEGHLHPVARGPRDDAPRRLRLLGAPGPQLHRIPVVQPRGEGLLVRALQRQQEAASQTHALLDDLRVEEEKPLGLQLGEGEGFTQLGGAGLLGGALQLEQAGELVEVGRVSGHGRRNVAQPQLQATSSQGTGM